MKYYIIYLKALWRNRKYLKQMVHSHLVSSGELLEYKKAKLIAQHFTKKVNHTPTKPPTEQEVKDFLAGKLIVTPESILEKK
jgi:hypothetical protein